ncbi:MAG: sugar phosphate isomerase/epimerase family protein [Methanomassiliicoccales archaeon]
MIAMSSPALSLRPFQEALEFVARRFPAWEIVGEGQHFLPDIEKEFLELTPSFDLRYSAHTPLSDVNIGSLNPRMRRAALNEVLQSIAAAGRMGITPFTVHPGFITPLGQLNKEGAWNATRASLEEAEKAAREAGVTLALENMPNMPISMLTNPDDLMRMLEGTELRVCWDIGHAHTTNNIKEYLPYWRRFANVHIHDNDGRHDQHLPLGEGSIDFPPILQRLKGYEGNFVIEARKVEGAEVSRLRLEKMLSAV